MKKTLVRQLALLLLAAMLLGALASCDWWSGGNDDDNTTTTTTTTKPSSDDGGNTTVWTPPADEYTIPKEEGCNQLTFYWSNTLNIDLSTCDIWIWYDGANGQGYLMHECEYGAKVVVNVPEDVTEVGFIVRKNCSDPGGTSWGNANKDGDSDRFAVITGEDTYIYLKNGDTYQYCSNDGGKNLEVIKLFSLAGMTTYHTIKFFLTPNVKLKSYDDITVWDGDTQLTVTEVSTMGKKASSGVITVEEKLQLDKIYEVEIEGFGRCSVVPTDIFDSKEFAEEYHYDGDDLGAYIHGDSTTFKVWAPTAASVVLNLYTTGHEKETSHDIKMVRGEKGVWSASVEGVGHGTYYTYTVTTGVGTQVATDPYARAAGLNGDRSMVVDLDLTDPEGWGTTEFDSGINSYSEAFIWEVHVRDFSNKMGGKEEYRGTYLAFTESGLVNENGIPVGIDYLKELGITHVHLNPVYDYATVDESDRDSQFNWGYDPKNYNVPEGSYSTDPYNGEVRINEFKQMVQALHDAGIGVIMDVVYNHTYDKNSAFNKIVPYYYYRYTSTGANSSASGCGNDTASERYMFNKFMVDSVTYWISEYDLDGFRFDLMGLHDLQTMKDVEAAVHAVDPKAIIYGEGWTMGSTIDGSAQANQGNISKIEATNGAIGSVAVFNDAIRDGLRGGNNGGSTGYISGAASANANKVKFGILGGMQNCGTGWTVNNGMVINYMSAHDNNTLWDQLSITRSTASLSERLTMNRLGAAILFISKGTPFIQAGEEMLRSKPKYDADGNLVYNNGKLVYDENSYNSCDDTNNIRWDVLSADSDEYKMMQYYAGLAKMRKAYPILSDCSADVQVYDLDGGKMAVVMKTTDGREATVLINPTSFSYNYTLHGQWNLVATIDQAGAEVIETKTGNVEMTPKSIFVFVR